MKYKNSARGWYKLANPKKFRKPLDETMESSKDGYVQYKSSLEYNAIRFADLCTDVSWWSLEPFPIPYIKPTDGKIHRYFPDMLIMRDKNLILIEVKSSTETKPPRKPQKPTPQAANNYNEALKTFMINTAKWAAAKKLCKEKKMFFCILTEKDLK